VGNKYEKNVQNGLYIPSILAPVINIFWEVKKVTKKCHKCVFGNIYSPLHFLRS